MLIKNSKIIKILNKIHQKKMYNSQETKTLNIIIIRKNKLINVQI